ncbi:MAG TPA: hypothetical protein VFE78_35680 [Gemmataceae bacterium]|jgi:hypothetical protein|nr:hypothetical protein [Gemmataceae bacterium]
MSESCDRCGGVGTNPRDRVKLPFGPCAAPRLRRGDRAACLYRGFDVIVTGWPDAHPPVWL